MTTMRDKGIEVSPHYTPLHSSPMGKKASGRFSPLPVTEDVAATLIRLPIYPGLSDRALDHVVAVAKQALKKM